MKHVFTVILVVHGFIHLLGFAKAFLFTDVSKQVLGISKPIGTLWLIVFILFVVVSSQFFNNKKWFYLAFITVFLSQILIVLAWKEAKFITISNFIILAVSSVALGNYNFSRLVKKETDALLVNVDLTHKELITQNHINHLPVSVQKWLNNSGVIGKEKVMAARLRQKGKMKFKSNANWMSFTAEQSFNVQNPAFIWTNNVVMNGFLFMRGRDKLDNGEGEMLIKFMALFPVVNKAKNEKINSGALLRFLAETCWFPSAAINDYITWEVIDETSAKATLSIDDQSFSGVFSFTSEGDFKSFDAKRYFGGKKDSELENWHIEALAYKNFDGLRIPSICSITWKLEDGDFEWLNLEIIDLKYN